MTSSKPQTPQAVTAATTTSDPRWAAVLAKDPQADGSFYYAVGTTGIYCRPSCAARAPRPEHVSFYTTCKDAAQAGFRPCKRCTPDQPSRAARHAAKVTEACRLIDATETALDLQALATRVGISAYHFHRVFKQITGLTPRDYARAQQDQRLRARLAAGADVTAAIVDAGYGAVSRFYERSQQVLGMTATAYRAGGTNTDIHFAVGDCALGAILVARSERGVCAIFMGDDPDLLVRDLQDRFPHANLLGGDAGFEKLVAKVVGWVEAPHTGGQGAALPLDIRGTVFQQRVWQALRQIPAGQTISYTTLAQRIGAPQAVRAVAQACGANVLAVAIPCHRVVRLDGSLSGYRWGVERKQALLAAEAQACLGAFDKDINSDTDTAAVRPAPG